MELVTKSQPAILDKLRATREQMRMSKIMFETQYNILLQYCYQMKKSAMPTGVNKSYQGEFLNDGEIQDNIGAHMSKSMASAILAGVWKGERGTLHIRHSRHAKPTREVLDYFTRITRDFSLYLENKKSRFESTLNCAVLEYVVFGTAGASVQRGDYITPLRFNEKSVLFFCVGFDGDGNVDRIFFDSFLTASELVSKYGEKNVPGTVLSAYGRNDYSTRFTVTEMIMPREKSEAAAGQLAMPYAAYEFMPNDNWFFREGGYESFPIPIMFCNRMEYESYGRSYAMSALPTIVQIQTVNEILAIGGEATALPPMGVFDNGSLGGQKVNLTSGALTVFNVAGTIPTEQPLFPLYAVGDLRVMFEYLKLLYERASQYFLLDKFYGFGTDQRMQNPEVMMRSIIQANATSSTYIDAQNFMVECFERGMDILFAMGLLGVKDPEDKNDPKVESLLANGHTPFKIPDSIWDLIERGIDWYEFEFINPFSRIMRSEALQASVQYLQTMGEVSRYIPSLADAINPSGTAENLRNLFAANMIMINSPDEIKRIQEQRAQMQMQMAQMEAQRLQSQSNQSNAQAEAARSGAVRNMQQMNAGVTSQE